MIRRMITIDEDLCNGCGLCVNACHEGAIELVNGRARLMRDDYCDGLGDCLPSCPTGAISFEEREALPYDEAAVAAHLAEREASKPVEIASQLMQWPVQIKLLPLQAPYYDEAELLIAADCTAFAYANFHDEFMRDKITLIGCPKLDEGDYTEKLSAIIASNTIASVTVVRMEVPCCGGLERAARTAVEMSGKELPFEVVTLSTKGIILERA